MSGRSTQWIWAVMMIVSLTSTAVLSQSLSQCLDDLNGHLSSLPSLSSMCTENNVQRKLVTDSNRHMCTCIRNMLTPNQLMQQRLLQYMYVHTCTYMYDNTLGVLSVSFFELLGTRSV